jgi:serine/threonine protein kinase
MTESGKSRPGMPLEVPGYRILRPIAAGGMGSVYEAEKLSTHERFAVKFIRGHLLGEATYYARFEREVSALRSIRHPNVVNLFEWCLPPPDSGDLPFVVMELLKGEALEAMLKRTPKTPWPMAVQILLQVLDGLAAAHSVGVIHRDLGPSNIYLTHEPNERIHVKLLDFGLARPLDDGDTHPGVTQEGTWMGKPAYVAPELFLNQTLDERCDIFACGMVLYKMLAGRFPYRETTSQLLWMERYAERENPPSYPEVRRFTRELPDDLAQIVAKAVAKKREDRYGSARHMQNDLLRFEKVSGSVPAMPALEPPRVTKEVSGSSVIAGRATPILLSPLRRIRPPVLAASIVGLALLVALIIILAGGGKPKVAAGVDAGPPDSSELVATLPVGDAAPLQPYGTSPDAAAEDGAANKAIPAPADATPEDATAEDTAAEDAATAAAVTVRLTLVGVPQGAELRVDGKLAPQNGWIELPKSTAKVHLALTVPSGRYEPWAQDVAPSASRTIDVQMRRIRTHGPTGPQTTKADAGSGIQGPFQTVFSTNYDDNP